MKSFSTKNLYFFKYLFVSLYLLMGITLGYSQSNEQLPSSATPTTPEILGSNPTQTGTIQITIRGSQKPIDVAYEVNNGFVTIQGDIVLGPESILLNRAAILNIAAAEWTNSTIPFTIEAGYPNVDMIHHAINRINKETNLCIVPRTTETNFVEFINAGGCASFVGMQGGLQNIFLNPGCGIGATMHEILHAAGHWHEQSRQDRDAHVTINTSEITPASAFNFDIYSTGLDHGPYDYCSIMHYGEFDFSSTGNPTITVKVPPADNFTDVGQRIILSQGDIDAVNSVYPGCGVAVPLISTPWNHSFCSKPAVEFCNGTVTLSNVTVMNCGTMPAPASQVIYGRQIPGSFLTMGDAPNDRPTIPPLAPGEKFTLPDYTADLIGLGYAGQTFNYFVWIDGFNAVGEQDRSDNARFFNSPLTTHTVDPVCFEEDMVISDPCGCDNPANCKDADGFVSYFHDVLSIAGGPTNANITLLNNGGPDVFMTGSCPTPVDVPNGTIIGTTDASGNAAIPFFHFTGQSGTIAVEINGTVITFLVEGCNGLSCPPEPIPTMSEWGLMIFGLLVLNLGVIFLRRREEIFTA